MEYLQLICDKFCGNNLVFAEYFFDAKGDDIRIERISILYYLIIAG
jgi:hypothetical protein